MTSLKRIELPDRRIADEVYEQLLEAISDGRIAPTDRLVQVPLAVELGVSRTPVREALLRLENEGVLVHVGRSGFQLRRITPTEVKQIYGTRQAIEGHAARVLADQGSEEDFAAIERQIDEEDQRELVTASDYYHSSRRVHREFVRRAHNPSLVEMFDTMWNRGVSFQIYTTTMHTEALAKSAEEHRVLLDEIRRLDGDRACALMQQHIVEGLELQLDAMVDQAE
jgi:DNA-binding GntR family transcriptional regulator